MTAKHGQATNELKYAQFSMRLHPAIRSQERAVMCFTGYSSLAADLPGPDCIIYKELHRAMLQELVDVFALKLETCPAMVRPQLKEPGGHVGQKKDMKTQTIIVGGGSHTSRLADALGQASRKVADLSKGGWAISKGNIAELALAISEA